MTAQPLAPAPDDAAHAKHALYLATFPKLALSLRELIESGWEKPHILAVLKRAGTASWGLAATSDEIDYLLATGAGGRSLRSAMSVDMAKPAP